MIILLLTVLVGIVATALAVATISAAVYMMFWVAEAVFQFLEDHIGHRRY
jgi:hypothetical protein